MAKHDGGYKLWTLLHCAEILGGKATDGDARAASNRDAILDVLEDEVIKAGEHWVGKMPKPAKGETRK